MSSYTSYTLQAIGALQSWYDPAAGMWDTTGWWNSANCLTVLADFAILDPSDANKDNINSVIQTTFTNAQKTTQVAQKTVSDKALTESSYTKLSSRSTEATASGYAGFINNYYDDEGWWALALIRSYDVTQNTEYLDMAEHIFDDMKNGTDDTCGGGIWWSKDKTYKNAIANELYLSVGASLANRVPSSKQYYLGIAQNQWNWFKGSGMINSHNTINDGLTISSGSCTNNGKTVWSYNQGVVLGGLVELNKANGNAALLSEASTIATAAIGALSQDGILHESCEPNCGSDGNQFKGIFMRNLMYLQQAAPQSAFSAYMTKNANSIWAADRVASDNTLGLVSSGPATAGGTPTAATQSSAMDALVAAMSVS